MLSYTVTCGCKVNISSDNSNVAIEYCPKHANASELFLVCIKTVNLLDDILVSDLREYQEAVKYVLRGIRNDAYNAVMKSKG